MLSCSPDRTSHLTPLPLALLSLQPTIGFTSEPGEGGIVAFRDYNKKFSSHLVSPWLSLVESLEVSFSLEKSCVL